VTGDVQSLADAIAMFVDVASAACAMAKVIALAYQMK